MNHYDKRESVKAIYDLLDEAWALTYELEKIATREDDSEFLMDLMELDKHINRSKVKTHKYIG